MAVGGPSRLRAWAADADLDRVIVGEPGLQLDERDVGFLRHLGAQPLVIGPRLAKGSAVRGDDGRFVSEGAPTSPAFPSH
jgi:hypothetical protein